MKSARGYLLGSLVLLAACSSGFEPEPALETLATPTTVRTSIVSASDDAEEIEGRSVQLTGSLLDLRAKGGVLQLTGLRFQNLQVPPGAKIENAYLVFKAGINDAEAVSLNLYGEASNNADTFSTAKNNLSRRTKTSAMSAWNPGSWAVGKSYQTPNLASVVQEIVSRSGWQSGNALALFVDGSSSAGERSAMAFGNPYGAAPELVVTYTGGDTRATAPALSGGPIATATSGTLTLKLADPKDDAEEGSSLTTTGKALDFSQNGQTVALRFTSVSLPQGAKIKAATVSFTAIADDSAPVNLQVRAEAADTAAPFNGSFTARAQTAASAPWQPEPWKRDQAVRTPDLSGVVQEVVSRGGWNSGNALAFYVTGDGSAKRSAYARDKSRVLAPVLSITYEAQPAPEPTPEPLPAPTPEPVTPAPVTPAVSASCLEGDAPLLTLAGDYTSRVYIAKKSVGIRVDAREAKLLARSAFLAEDNSSLCLSGGFLDNGLSDDTDWDTFHSSPGLLFYDTPKATVENMTIIHTGDGITFKNNNPNWLFRNSYIRHAGDDGVENDRFNDGTVDDVLIDWAYTGLSCRKEQKDARNVNYSFKVQNTLLALKPQKGTYGRSRGGSGPASHNELFKVTKEVTKGCRLVLRDNVFLISGYAGKVDPSEDPRVKYDILDRGACRGHKNTIVYTGGESWYLKELREAAPECFDVTTDLGVWKTARARWFDRHPQFAKYRDKEPTGAIN